MAPLRWIAGFIIALLIAAFAVANRQSVDFYWSPLHDALHVPLYLLTVGAMGFGFLLGAFIVWFGALPVRYSSWRQRRVIAKLEKELKDAHKDPNVATPTARAPLLPSYWKKN